MKKRWLSLLLSITMLLSLVTVPTQAALVDGTATLTVTPNVTAVKAGSDAVEITYTITLTPPANKTVGPFQFTLVAPEGMTLSETKLKSSDKGGNGYWVNTKELKYNEDDETGTFGLVGYAPSTKTFAAAMVEGDKISSSVDVMTIRATIATGNVGDFELDVTNCVIAADGEASYSVELSTTPVSVYSELDGAAVTGLTAPVKGGTPDGEVVSSTDHTSATVAWFLGENAVTGNFAASTQYTAQITVTPEAGYRFAEGALFTVDGATDWVVTDGQNDAKVLTKTFPATADKSLLSLSVTTAPNKTKYEVGNNFDATGMVVSAHYDEGPDETYSNYTVQGGENLAYGTYPVTIVSNDDSSVSTTTDITVSRKNLTGDDFEYTNGTATYDGTDHASTAKNIQGFKEGLMGSLSFIFFKVGDNVVQEVQELINAGVYTVYVSTEEGTMYNAMGQTEVGTFTINKADATLNAPTAATGLTYNSQAQTLVNAGTATGGELQYKLGDDGTYSTSVAVATATDAGTYTVYYKVVGNDNYNGVNESSVTVTIAKAPITPTVSIDGWTYGEAAKEPSVNGNSGEGTVTYSYAAKGTNDFSDTVPSNAGSYTVKATIAETTNYLGGEATEDFTIAKANASVTAPATKTDLTYNGQDQALIDAGSTTGGTMQYKLGADGTYSPDIPKATEAGNYTVYYKVVGNDNYNDVKESRVTVTIKKQPVDVSQLTWQTTNSFNYDGQAKTVTLSSAIPQGLTANYEHNTATYVGEYTATVSFTADDNHEVSGTPDTFSWKINPVANPIAITTTTYNLAKGGNTLDLATLIQNAEGTVTFSIKSGDAAELNGSVLTSGADSSATPVVIRIHVDAVYKNSDATPEFNAYDNDSAITVTVVNKEQKELTVTMGGWTYGDNAKSPVFTAPAGSYAPVITYTGENYSSTTAPTNAGTYTVQVVCETAKEIYTGTAEFTIGAKEVKLNWGDTNLTYNGKDQAPTATAEGLVSGDSCIVTVTGAQKVVGTNYTATAESLDNTNYKLPAVNTKRFAIGAKEVKLNWGDTNLTYNGQLQAPTATAEGLVGNDSCIVTVTGARKDAGSYTAKADKLDNTNYKLPAARTQSFTIGAKEVTLNWGDTNLTYNGKDQAPTATAEGLVGDDSCIVTVTGAQKNAGDNYTATASIGNRNYKLPEPATCTFTIAPKDISDMTVNLSAAALTYNGKAQTKAVASVRDGSTTLSSGRDYNVSGDTQTDAGQYKLTVTGTGNYTGSKTVDWEIAPKAVTVTANNVNRVYGAKDPALTAKVRGTVGSDTVDYKLSRALGDNVGTYDITASGEATQGNYTVTFKNGTFTITKANASVTSAPQAVTGLKFNGEAKKLVTAGQAEGGELQYKLGNGAYGTKIPTATEAGTYTVYYKVEGDANHNNVSEARITVTIAPLSGEDVVTGEGVSQMKDSQIQEFREALAQVEQFTDERVGITEQDDTPAKKQAKREAAIKKIMKAKSGFQSSAASALYYVSANSADASQITLAVPNGAANRSSYNYKVMYMAADGTVTQVTNAKVTASGIEVPVAANGNGVYMVAYEAKPIPVIIHDDTVKSAGTGDMGLVLYTVLAVSGATGAAWLGLKKRKED